MENQLLSIELVLLTSESIIGSEIAFIHLLLLALGYCESLKIDIVRALFSCLISG